jgi:phytoene dehydrogenase-like protein
MENAADVIVIGAGHNGLVCAAYLAKAGLDVLVVERSHRLGGACITEELVPGFKFSTFAYSAHGPGPKICRDLEIPAEAIQVLDMNPEDPGMFFPFPDGDHVMLWNNEAKTLEQLARFGSGTPDGYSRYVKFMAAAISLAQEWFLSPPLTHDELYALYRGTPQAAILETLLTRSHWDVLGDYFENEKVKSALAKADDVGDPMSVGSLLAEVIESASTGAGLENKTGLVRGGMGSITAALAAAAQKFGAEIRSSSPVEQIVVEHGAATGVRLAAGETLRARFVISNADPKRTFLV